MVERGYMTYDEARAKWEQAQAEYVTCRLTLAKAVHVKQPTAFDVERVTHARAALNRAMNHEEHCWTRLVELL